LDAAVGGDARCALCQQVLVPEASDRLVRFQRLMTGELQVASVRADSELARLAEAVARLDLDLSPVEALAAESPEALRPVLEAAREYVTRASARRDALTEARDELDGVPELPDCPAALLEEHAALLERERADPEPEGCTDDAPRLRREIAELEACVWLAAHRAEVLRECDRATELHILASCRAQARTGLISTESRRIWGLLARGGFVPRFRRELEALGLGPDAFTMGPHGVKGSVCPRIAVAGVDEDLAGRVASEGEQRIAALAGFLAEASEQPTCAIVLDDPTSSLDTPTRKRLATRLTQEAKRRQVIIFTHDREFIAMLREAGEADCVSLHGQRLRRTQEGTGVILADEG
jgi:hypothetical protein